MGNNLFFRFWICHSMRNLHVTLGVLAVGMQVIGRLSGHSYLLVAGDTTALAGISHYFIHGYFYRQQKFISDNQRVYSLPRKKIARTGALFLVLFLTAAAVGMAVIRELYSGTLLAKLKAMAFFLLGKLFGAIFETDGLGRGELLFQDNTTLFGAMNQFSRKTESPWERLMENIQTVLIIVGVVFLLVLCVLALVSYLRKAFGKVKLRVDGQRGLETVDMEERIRGRAGNLEKLLDFSPTAKVRRIYRRCVNRKRRHGQAVQEWMSPAEIERMVRFPAEEKYEKLHTVYEKARYSESGCTDEELRQMKALKI